LIDTQLNIHSEVSIIVVQAHSGRKGDICTYTYTLMMKSEQKHLRGGGEREQTRAIRKVTVPPITKLKFGNSRGFSFEVRKIPLRFKQH
jgi:hypothetical protein